MAEVYFARPELYVPTPAKGLTVGCMDDRPWEQPWLQIAGGAHGAAVDRTAAMELEESGSFVKLGVETHLLAGMVVGAGRQQGLELLFHEKCTSFELAETIGDVLHDPSKEEAIFEHTQKIDPGYAGMSTDKGFYVRFMPALRAQRRATDGLTRHEIVEVDLFEDDAQRGTQKTASYLFVPPTRVALAEQNHEAVDIVVNQTRGHLFNSRQAWNEGKPAYSIGIGQFETINHSLNKHLGRISTEGFVQVSAVRHGALTAIVLPQSTGGGSLQLHTIKNVA